MESPVGGYSVLSGLGMEITTTQTAVALSGGGVSGPVSATAAAREAPPMLLPAPAAATPLTPLQPPAPAPAAAKGLTLYPLCNAGAFGATPRYCGRCVVRTQATNSIFTARCYASAVLALALCLSVCLSVTSRCSTKMAKRRITQTTPHDSPSKDLREIRPG